MNEVENLTKQQMCAIFSNMLLDEEFQGFLTSDTILTVGSELLNYCYDPGTANLKDNRDGTFKLVTP